MSFDRARWRAVLPTVAAVVTLVGVLAPTLVAPEGLLVVAHAPKVSWGERIQGERVRVPFTLLNPGTEECRILKVVPSCSCARVEGLSRTLGPGEEASGVMNIDTSGYVGRIETGLILIHDGKNGPRTVLECHGNVLAGVSVHPLRWSIGTVDVKLLEEAPSIRISIRSDADMDLSSVEFEDSLGLFECDWQPASRGERSCMLRLKEPWVVGPMLTRPRFRSGKVVKELLVSGQLRGPLLVDPQRVQLQLRGKSGRSGTTSIAARTGEILSVRVLAQSTQLRAEIVSTSPKQCRIRVGAAETLSGAGQGVVCLKVRHRRAGSSSLEGIQTYRVLIPVHWNSLSAYEDY